MLDYIKSFCGEIISVSSIYTSCSSFPTYHTIKYSDVRSWCSTRNMHTNLDCSVGNSYVKLYMEFYGEILYV